MEDFILANDSIFAERYQIRNMVGVGGMGRVYRAYDLTLERIVAIKLLNASLLGDVEDRARFKSEGRVLAQVNHDNVVQFYQYGIFEDRLPYMVMEYVEGRSLRAVLDERKRLDAATTIDFALQICEGLKVVHALDVVHRDLKPANILVTTEGERKQIKILDFGLSRILLSSPVSITQHLTKTGLLVGSVHYMSPEQCMGRKVDQRADIYALGCLIYEMLCGEFPFASDSPLGMLAKHVSEEPRTLGDFTQKIELPSGITSVIEKAMRKNPNDRYATIERMEDDLKLVRDRKGKQAALIGFDNKTNSKTRKSSSSLDHLGPLVVVVASCLLVILPVFESIFGVHKPAVLDPPQGESAPTRELTFDTQELAKVSGRVVYIELDRSDPTILNRLLIEPEDGSRILNLSSHHRVKTPIHLFQNVDCTIDGDYILRSVSIVPQHKNSTVYASAIKIMDEFMNLMQKNKWAEASKFIDPKTSSDALNARIFKMYWGETAAHARNSNKYVRENYNGYAPQSYRILSGNEETVLLLVKNSEFFTNLERLDRFSLNYDGQEWRVGRVQTDFEEPPPRVLTKSKSQVEP